MKNTIQYYPKEKLPLRSPMVGVKMWGVALEQTLLTYFEVDSNSRFEGHSHESEQITMVLEGQLFFEVYDEVICVGSGEVIAIPSMEPHAAFTKETPVKAVDAWSPVMDKYK